LKDAPAQLFKRTNEMLCNVNINFLFFMVDVFKNKQLLFEYILYLEWFATVG